MTVQSAAAIAVIDFRRQGMVLSWRTADGTWTPCDIDPPRVHGIALIRASQPNICVYGQSGTLVFQAGAMQYPLSDSARLLCSRGIATFGFRRHFTLDPGGGGTPFSLGYWTAQRHDFFDWLARKLRAPHWRADRGLRWSEGLGAATLRRDEDD